MRKMNRAQAVKSSAPQLKSNLKTKTSTLNRMPSDKKMTTFGAVGSDFNLSISSELAT